MSSGIFHCSWLIQYNFAVFSLLLVGPVLPLPESSRTSRIQAVREAAADLESEVNAPVLASRKARGSVVADAGEVATANSFLAKVRTRGGGVLPAAKKSRQSKMTTFFKKK